MNTCMLLKRSGEAVHERVVERLSSGVRKPSVSIGVCKWLTLWRSDSGHCGTMRTLNEAADGVLANKRTLLRSGVAGRMPLPIDMAQPTNQFALIAGNNSASGVESFTGHLHTPLRRGAV